MLPSEKTNTLCLVPPCVESLSTPYRPAPPIPITRASPSKGNLHGEYRHELVWRYRFAPRGRGRRQLRRRHRARDEGPGDLSFAGAGGRIEPFDGGLRNGRWRHPDPDENEPHPEYRRRLPDRRSGRHSSRHGQGSRGERPAVLREYRDRQPLGRQRRHRRHQGCVVSRANTARWVRISPG